MWTQYGNLFRTDEHPYRFVILPNKKLRDGNIGQINFVTIMQISETV